MFDQKLLYKTMLWSLGVAAFLGVVAVLTASFDTVGRVTATAFLTSAVAALLWQASARLERNELSIWTAQIGAMLFYLCALCGIWEIGDEGKLWGTGFVFLGCSAVAAGGWAAQEKDDYRHVGFVAALISLVVAACWLWGIWIEPYGQEMMMTGFALAGWGVAGSLCLVGSGAQSGRDWRWIGVAAAAVGVVLSEYGIFLERPEAWLMKTLFVLGSIAAVVIHAVLCYASRSAPQTMTIRQVAIAATIATAICVDIMVLQEIEGDSLIVRMAIAAAIVASTSTIATAFIVQSHWRSARTLDVDRSARAVSEEKSAANAEFSTLRVECPKCNEQVQLAVGSSTCPHCGLRFQIEIFAPAPQSRLDGWIPDQTTQR